MYLCTRKQETNKSLTRRPWDGTKQKAMIQYQIKKGDPIVNTYVNGTKSAILLCAGNVYLMSHCKKWDGTNPGEGHMHGWKFGRVIGTTDDDTNDKDTIVRLINGAFDTENFVTEITFEGEPRYAEIRAKVEEHAAARRAAKENTPAPAATSTNEEVSTPAPAATSTNEEVSTPAEPAAPTMDAATTALAGLFGGVTSQVTANVMAQVKKMLAPIMNAAPVVHEYKIVRVDGTTHTTTGEHYHAKFNEIVQAISMDEFPYLYGPAGSGKSEIARQAAAALGLDFYMQSCITETFTLSGFKSAAGEYQETPFYKAFKFGGLYLLDEMDACLPEVLTNLNQALANGYYNFAGETVKANENFRIIGTGNTALQGADLQYITRYQMDKATIDRFDPIFIDYDSEIEKVCANGDKSVLDFIYDLRQSAAAAGVDMILGYRAISKLRKLSDPKVFEVFKDDLLQMAVLKGMQTDEINILYNGLQHKDNSFAEMMYNLCA